MANTDFTGFYPLKSRTGGLIVYSRKQALNANTLAIFMGDAVSTTGGTGLWYPVADTNGGSAGSTGAIGSIMCGAVYTNASNEVVKDNFLPASTTGSATADAETASWITIVEDAVNTVFQGQTDTAFTQTSLGNCYDMLLGAGSTITGRSGHEINGASADTAIDAPWKVHDFVFGGVVGSGLNDITLADAKVECTINAHNYAAIAGTTAGG